MNVLVAWIAAHPAAFFFFIALAASFVAARHPIDEHWGDGMR